MTLKENILEAIDKKVKDDFLRNFRKEVDFHHKVDYHFEKAYRLGKENS